MLKKPKGALAATLPKASLDSAGISASPAFPSLSLKPRPLYWPRPSLPFLLTPSQRTDPSHPRLLLSFPSIKPPSPNASSAPSLEAPPPHFLSWSSSLPRWLRPPLFLFTCSPAPSRAGPHAARASGKRRGTIWRMARSRKYRGFAGAPGWAGSWESAAVGGHRCPPGGPPTPAPSPRPPYPCGALCGAWCWPFFYSLFLLGRRKEGE